jgi:lysozyme
LVRTRSFYLFGIFAILIAACCLVAAVDDQTSWAASSTSSASEETLDGWQRTADGTAWNYYQNGVKVKSKIIKTAYAPGSNTASTSHYYWIGANGNLKQSGIYHAKQDSKAFWVYALASGQLVTGKTEINGKFYLATSKGHLYEGFVTSSKFDGKKKTYYINPKTHAAQTGFFSVKGARYYGDPDEGWLATGTYRFSKGKYLLASSKGILCSKAGWLTSSSYSSNNSSKRYYLVALKKQSGVYVTKTGFFKASYKGKKYRFYGIPTKGYLARGAYKYDRSHTLLASSKAGILKNAPGWLHSSAYSKGKTVRTYRMVKVPGHKGYHAALTGLFKVGKARYYGIPGKGYIAKGAYRYSKKYTLLANKTTGRLCNKSGWMKTSKYVSGKKKHTYRMQAITGHSGFHAARTGFFKVKNKRYYGIPGKGYIRQNSIFTKGTTVWKASKSGALKRLGNSSQRLNGIDVSSWQSDINLTKVDADFVIIKATEGTYYKNPYYKTMAKQALASGKLIGFYHFATGGTLAHAKKEADYFINAVGDYAGKAVLVLDWESTAVNSGPAYAKAFLNRVKAKTGSTPMIYMSKSVTHNYSWSKISSSYPLWCAQYANYNRMTYTTSPWTDATGYGSWKYPTIYQYTSNGKVSGYSGSLDLDLFYGNASDWKAYY